MGVERGDGEGCNEEGEIERGGNGGRERQRWVNGEVWRVDMKERGRGGRRQQGGGDGRGGQGEGGRQGEREGGNGEGKMGRVAMGRLKWGGRGKRGQAHRMPGWNEVTVFPDSVYPCNAGYPS